jgi:hypothetical protein
VRLSFSDIGAPAIFSEPYVDLNNGTNERKGKEKLPKIVVYLSCSAGACISLGPTTLIEEVLLSV